MQRLHPNRPQLIAILVAATTLFSLWGAANSPVRGALIAVLLVLLGLALVTALFPGQRLGGAERTLYVLVASIAAVAVSGLVLNISPWGLDSLAWALLLAVGAAGAAIFAWMRRSQSKTPAREESQGLESLNLPQVSLFGLSVVMLGLALTIARAPALPDGYQGYSMLSILPASEADTATWQISVDSKEFFAATYSLTVSLEDEIVYLSPNFTLAPHQRWQTQVDLSSYGRKEGELVARLYRSDSPGVVYRHVLVHDTLHSGGG